MKIVSANNNQVAVVFSKHDLIAMKEGKTLNADLLSDGKKHQFVFLRDRTFESVTRKWEAAAKAAVESASAVQPNQDQSTPTASSPAPTELNVESNPS